jgi:lipopolysaccharide export system protein LptC
MLPPVMTSGTLALAPDAAGRADARARAFAVARRHSAQVRAARRALEIGVVLVVAGFAGMALLRNFGRALRDVTFEGIGIEGGRITMDKPRLSGSRPGGGGYNITAVKAMQDAQHPGDVDLALIGGDIAMPDREVSRLSANSGHYESVDEALELAGDVRLTNSHYEIYLQSVRIQFKKGEYVSKEPVKVRILPDATVSADSFAAQENGAVVRFEGRVRTLINGQAAAVGAAP